MSKTLTARQGLEQVAAQAEKIRNDETAAIGTVSRGDVVRQGDIYLVCITGVQPAKKALIATKDRQLAPGTSQGSRHILSGRCEVYRCDSAAALKAIAKAAPKAKVEAPLVEAPLVGLIFRTLGEVELTHPEHGNRILPADEWFAVVYQRAFADEVRRQQD